MSAITELIPSLVCLSGSSKEKNDLLNSLPCGRIHVDIGFGDDVPTGFFREEDFTESERALFDAAVDFHICDNRYAHEWASLPYRVGDRAIVHVYPWAEHDEVAAKLNVLNQMGIRIGIALDIKTSIHALSSYVGAVEMILVMANVVGQRGVPLSHQARSRIVEVNALTELKLPKIKIGIDGGVSDSTFNWISGLSDSIVLGSLLFDVGDIAYRWRFLNERIIKSAVEVGSLYD